MTDRFRPGLMLLIIILIGGVCASSLPAESFPPPDGNGEKSLLGLSSRKSDPSVRIRSLHVDLEGPARAAFRFDGAEWETRWIRVEPGRYRIAPSGTLVSVQGAPDSVDVPPNSVVLAPFLVETNADGAAIRRIEEGDRQRAGRDLASHVDFPLWSSRDFVGFGMLRPEIDPESEQYTVAVAARPEGAEVFVDDVLAGTAPMEFSLPGGKHRILVRAAGYEDAVYYTRLLGNAVIDADLVPASEDSGIAERESYGTLVSPFVTLDEANDQLARLFADTLLLALEEDPRLDVSPSAIPWERRSALIHPDFMPLEEAGADLMVGGFFIESENGLTVQANLYDVQAETIRAAVTWTGRVGLDIFDAMDEIAAAFAAEVDRVLPEAGRTLVRRQETVYAGSDESASRLSRKKLIRKRWQGTPNVLTFETGIGGLFESYVMGAETKAKLNGPYIPGAFSWDRDMGQRFALGAGAAFEPTWTGQEYSDSDHRGEFYWMTSVWGGPRLVFRSLRSDISIGVDLKLRFSPGVTYNYWDGAQQSEWVGAMVYLETPVKVGFRYYFNERIDRMPLFLSGGIAVTPIGVRFDLGGTGRTGLLDSDFVLSFGMGVRL